MLKRRNMRGKRTLNRLSTLATLSPWSKDAISSLRLLDSDPGKRKQSFEGGSATKKRCLDDEKLLTEDPVDILDCVEVTINEADEPNMLISDAFSLKNTPKKKSYTSEMSFLDDDIIID